MAPSLSIMIGATRSIKWRIITLSSLEKYFDSRMHCRNCPYPWTYKLKLIAYHCLRHFAADGIGPNNIGKMIKSLPFITKEV